LTQKRFVHSLISLMIINRFVGSYRTLTFTWSLWRWWLFFTWPTPSWIIMGTTSLTKTAVHR